LEEYNYKECRFGYGHFFSRRTIIAKPLPDDMPAAEKMEIISRQKAIFQKDTEDKCC